MLIEGPLSAELQRNSPAGQWKGRSAEPGRSARPHTRPGDRPLSADLRCKSPAGQRMNPIIVSVGGRVSVLVKGAQAASRDLRAAECWREPRCAA
jgi:hypothetical protein